jgi:glutamate synthase domain-containing protein 2
LLFNPIYLSKEPLGKDEEVKTEIVLGPSAKNPLRLNIPIMLGGMSYGNSLSLKSMLALARGASLAGTAVNSGNGPFLEEVREIADAYGIQFPRSFWSRDPKMLRKVDLIEIGIGHSAWASAPIRIAGYKVLPALARRVSTIPGLDIVIDSRLPGVESCADLRRLVNDLKEKTEGSPVAFKFGASNYLETEIEMMIEAGADIVVFDGITGGTHGSPPTIQDNFGLPLLPGLCRAAGYIEAQRLGGKVSLVVGGGLTTPGDFLKCLALGADAVIIGTIAALTMVHTEVIKAVPWEPPTGLLYFDGKEVKKYDPVKGGDHLANYLQSCVLEMKEVARSLGKNHLNQIDKKDLVALDRLISNITGVEYMDGFQVDS